MVVKQCQVQIVKLHGEFGIGLSLKLADLLAINIRGELVRIAVGFERVFHAQPQALADLALWNHRMRGYGGGVCVFSMSARLIDYLGLYGLTWNLPRARTEDEAVMYFKNQPAVQGRNYTGAPNERD